MLTKRISRRGLAGLCVIGTLCASTGATPSAADACTGTRSARGMSIPNTVDGAPTGTTFCIAPGLYRVGRTSPPRRATR